MVNSSFSGSEQLHSMRNQLNKTVGVRKSPRKKLNNEEKGKRKLDFKDFKRNEDNSKLNKKAFTGKTYYLDGIPHNKDSLIRKRILQLGGEVEEFFSKDIYMVISSHKLNVAHTDTTNCANSSSVQAPSPAYQQLQSPFSNTTDFSPQLSVDNGNKFKQMAPVSRGKGILTQVLSSKKGYGKMPVVEKAKKLGIKIVSVEDFMYKYMRRKSGDKETHLKCRDEKKSLHMMRTNRVKSISDVKVYKLTKPFFKIEDNSKAFRPIVYEPKVWPEISYETSKYRSPFDAPTEVKASKDKKVDAADFDVETLSCDGQSFSSRRGDNEAPSKIELAQAKQASKQAGYCDCCSIKYDDLEQHLKSSQHQAFAKDKSNFKDLDKLINDGPDFYGFLSRLNKFLHDFPPDDVESTNNDNSCDEMEDREPKASIKNVNSQNDVESHNVCVDISQEVVDIEQKTAIMKSLGEITHQSHCPVNVTSLSKPVGGDVEDAMLRVEINNDCHLTEARCVETNKIDLAVSPKKNRRPVPRAVEENTDCNDVTTCQVSSSNTNKCRNNKLKPLHPHSNDSPVLKRKVRRRHRLRSSQSSSQVINQAENKNHNFEKIWNMDHVTSDHENHVISTTNIHATDKVLGEDEARIITVDSEISWTAPPTPNKSKTKETNPLESSASSPENSITSKVDVVSPIDKEDLNKHIELLEYLYTASKSSSINNLKVVIDDVKSVIDVSETAFNVGEIAGNVSINEDRIDIDDAIVVDTKIVSTALNLNVDSQASIVTTCSAIRSANNQPDVGEFNTTENKEVGDLFSDEEEYDNKTVLTNNILSSSPTLLQSLCSSNKMVKEIADCSTPNASRKKTTNRKRTTNLNTVGELFNNSHLVKLFVKASDERKSQNNQRNVERARCKSNYSNASGSSMRLSRSKKRKDTETVDSSSTTNDQKRSRTANSSVYDTNFQDSSQIDEDVFFSCNRVTGAKYTCENITDAKKVGIKIKKDYRSLCCSSGIYDRVKHRGRSSSNLPSPKPYQAEMFINSTTSNISQGDVVNKISKNNTSNKKNNSVNNPSKRKTRYNSENNPLLQEAVIQISRGKRPRRRAATIANDIIGVMAKTTVCKINNVSDSDFSSPFKNKLRSRRRITRQNSYSSPLVELEDFETSSIKNNSFLSPVQRNESKFKILETFQTANNDLPIHGSSSLICTSEKVNIDYTSTRNKSREKSINLSKDISLSEEKRTGKNRISTTDVSTPENIGPGNTGCVNASNQVRRTSPRKKKRSPFLPMKIKTSSVADSPFEFQDIS